VCGGLVQKLGASDALGRVREQVTGTLAGGVQPGHGLIQVDADPAHQPGGADELTQGLAVGRVGREALAAGHGEGRLGHERTFGEPGPLGGGLYLTELSFAEIEPDRA
jgi:hypothetical protein